MEDCSCVFDFMEVASKTQTKQIGEYFNAGADDQITVQENRDAYSRWKIRPRMLRDVSVISTTVEVLGKPVKVPIGVSPMSFQRLATAEGECASAKACESVGGIFILPLYGTCSIEQVAEAAPTGRKWLQLFIHKDRAEVAGYEAIVVTVDAPYMGNRRDVRRNPVKYPDELRLANVSPDIPISKIDFVQMRSTIDLSVTWSAVTWLKSITKLPIVIKGIQTSEDALIAVEHGIDAIFISNHGGRQIDTAVPTIDILPEIVEATGGRCEIYIDGGITKGTDIFKALAVGAKMVFVGRPIIWGLAVNGEKGAQKVLSILKEELELTLGLTGCASVKYITKPMVRQMPNCK